MFLSTIKFIASRAGSISAVIIFCLISGCVAIPKSNPTDPLEPFNRQMFEFNENVDKAFLRPVAQGYRALASAHRR